MLDADRYVNGSHARHYIDQAKGSHSAITRLVDENRALRARVEELEAQLADDEPP